MSALTLPRPSPGEAPPFQEEYIAEVTGQNIGEQFVSQLADLERLFSSLDDAAALARYAPGKWSIKEIIGHLSDAERIFAYRLLRVARGDTTPLPGFDENAYVRPARFDERPLRSLLAEFRAVRLATMALVSGIPSEGWSRHGEASGHPVSARALAYVILGHAAHHVSVLRSRYGLGAGAGVPSGGYLP